MPPGSGRQTVNKVSTAVALPFDVRRSAALTDDIGQRLERLAGQRLTSDWGRFHPRGSTFYLKSNREDARAGAELIRQRRRRRKRIKTKVTLKSKVRRLEGKSKRSTVKKMRSSRGARGISGAFSAGERFGQKLAHAVRQPDFRRPL